MVGTHGEVQFMDMVTIYGAIYIYIYIYNNMYNLYMVNGKYIFLYMDMVTAIYGNYSSYGSYNYSVL